jgi:magnesium-transporting ATPase (P-type)
LHADGILIIMLNGDNRTTAEAVTRKPGLDRVNAEALTEKKSIGQYCPKRGPAAPLCGRISSYGGAVYHRAGVCVQATDCDRNPRALPHPKTWKLTHEQVKTTVE